MSRLLHNLQISWLLYNLPSSVVSAQENSTHFQLITYLQNESTVHFASVDLKQLLYLATPR